MPDAASCGLSVGTALAWARAALAEGATVVALLADWAAKVGCVMLAALVATDWRETLEEDGLGTPLCAVRGPLLVGTSAAVVTTFATPLFVLRVDAVEGEGVAAGDSTGESVWEVARRVALGLVTAMGVVAATWAGAGSPAEVDVCGAVVA